MGSLLCDSGCYSQLGYKISLTLCLSGKALVGSVLIIGVEISSQPSPSEHTLTDFVSIIDWNSGAPASSKTELSTFQE